MNTHKHKCTCGWVWECLRPMKGKLCEVEKAAQMNGDPPRCPLCFHLLMAQRIAESRGLIMIYALNDRKALKC